MLRKAREFGDRERDLQTSMNRSRIKSAVKLAKQLTEDPQREHRLARQICTVCFYITRLAGQSFTNQPCACCGEVQTYPSTDTNALCQPCAAERQLCKHCGGAIEIGTIAP